jgi:ATP-binding cassette subfamily F protein 3
VCGAFLFPGEDVDKAVGVLSGGEKARVCLARILVRPGNFLLMDEPTNHLDLLSSETLIEALAEYDGTLLFVSHNQAFVNRLATKIWDVRDGELVEYPGTLDEYYARMAEAEATLEARSPSEDDVDMGDDAPKTRKEMRKARAENRRKTRAALGPIQSALRRTEERIHRLEARQKTLEQELADPEIFRDETRSVPLLKEYDRIKNDLDALMAEWEQGQERLESMMQEIDG